MADTGLTLVTNVLEDLGVVGSGETARAADSTLVLRRLNNLLDAWNIDGLTVYRIAQISHTFTASQGSYTIGKAGGEDIDQTRPPRILDGSFVRDANSADHPLTVLQAREEYDAIVSKSAASTYPQWLWYDPAFPSGTIYYWEVPDTALTAYLNVPAALSAMALTDTVTFPPGYREALQLNTALRCASAFGVQVDAMYQREALRAKGRIKAANLVGRQKAVRFPARLRGRRSPMTSNDVQAGEYF